MFYVKSENPEIPLEIQEIDKLHEFQGNAS